MDALECTVSGLDKEPATVSMNTTVQNFKEHAESK